MYELKLLYAEDDIKLQTQYGKFFETLFSKVFICSDGEEAYEYYQYYNPDIIVTDINMPKINGLEFAKKVRQENKETKIIMLTSYSDKEKLLEAITLNLVEYLIKPVKLSKLKETLELCANEILVPDENIVEIGKNVIYNFTDGVLNDKKNCVKLTKNEKRLVELFIKNKFQTLSTEHLFENVWEDYDYSLTKLRSLVNRLNAKFTNKLIISDYGIGYKIDTEIKTL